MNSSSSQRVVWTLALGSILTLGFGTYASARDNPRDRAGQEHAKEHVKNTQKNRRREEGLRAGRADHQDGWRGDYRSSWLPGR